MQKFFGITKYANYKEMVSKLLRIIKPQGCNIFLEIYFLDSHLYFSPENWDAISNEHGEIFHQDIMAIEKRYLENGHRECSQIFVGHQKNLKKKQNEQKCLRNILFLINCLQNSVVLVFFHKKIFRSFIFVILGKRMQGMKKIRYEPRQKKCSQM